MNMKKMISAILVIIIVFSLAACGSVSSSPSENADAVKDMTSSDGILQLTVPEGYEETDALNNEVANLQLMYAAKEQYIMTIFESKIDFSEDMTLDDFRDAVMQNMQMAESAEFSDAESLTINGYDAQQFTMSGEVSKIKLKYLVTVIETDSGFCQILSWSLQSRYDEAEDVFKQIAESFTEL